MIACPVCSASLPEGTGDSELMGGPPVHCNGCQQWIQVNLDGSAELCKNPPPPPKEAPKPIDFNASLELADEVVEEVAPEPPKPRSTGKLEKPKRPPPLPFPRAEVVAAGKALAKYLVRHHRGVQVGLGVFLLMCLGLLGFMVRGTTKLPYDVAYASEKYTATLGPGADYRPLHNLDRGDELRVFEKVGNFALVRDAKGRAGFVPSAGLLSSPPPAISGLAFADCQRASFEPTSDRCQDRATDQQHSCEDSCGNSGDPQTCRAGCQKLFAACTEKCVGPVFADQIPPVAPPKRERETQVSLPASTLAPSDDSPGYAPPKKRLKGGKKKGKR